MPSRRASRLVPLLSLLLASAAPAVECGETVSGAISSPGEIDTYPLSLAAGDVVSVTVSPWIGVSFAPVVMLLTPAQQPVLLGAVPFCGPAEVCASVPAPVSGSYTLRVVGNNSTSTGSYAVTIETLSGSWNGGSNAPPAPACGAAADGMLPIGCGETISGAIDTFGDSDAYTFLAGAGDRIGLHGNVALELFAPGGARVGFDGGSPSCTTPCASDALPATGVYTIRAVSFAAGPYSFTLESLRESFAGGSRAQLCGTTPQACNETRAGAIDQFGDSDTFSFFAEAGDVPWVLPRTTVVGPTTFLPYVERFAPDGTRLPATNSALPATGVYTLRITDGGDSTGLGGEPADATGGYELSVVGAKLGGAVCPRFPELACGTFASGSIPSEGGHRFHSFTARAGDVMSLVMRKEPPLAPIGMAVIGPDGSNTGATITSSGTHTVFLGGAGGSYWLSLESLAGSWNGGSNTAPTPVCGAVADGTRVIGCGQTRTAAIGVAGDRDAYTFFAEAGDFVSAQVSPNGVVPSSFWVLPKLYGANGVPVPACGFGCMVQSIPVTGAYTLLVSAASELSTGAYTVTLTRTPCASDCNDGADNDGDALVDTADDGCTSTDDLSEAPECSDGRDNDGDGAFDFSGADLGCASPLGAMEDPGCDDGFDNDRDGATDADGGGTGIVDASCGGVASNGAEVAGNVGCGLGPELVLLLPLLAARRRRAA